MEKKRQKDLRPTTGKVKQALFNILRDKIENARFLDLYAGTGAIGIEALKEGASEVVFVEESRKNARKISELVNRFHFSKKARVVIKKVLPFIDRAGLDQMVFDIIFLDPPYHTDEIIHTLSALDKSRIIEENGIVIAEHFAKKCLPERLNRLYKIKDYNYGDTVLSLYQAM
jgi:16S rRNA (guanine(966)-N(2))-methyltransferase RsmD